MAYRTFRQAASEASVPEQRSDYIDYESTPQRRLIANLIALGIPVGGLTSAGLRTALTPTVRTADGIIRSVPLKDPFLRAVTNVLPPAAGTTAGTLTGAAVTAAGGNDVRPNSAAIPGYEGDSPRERIAVTMANDILARQREAADNGSVDRANFHDEAAIPNPMRSMANRPAPRAQNAGPAQIQNGQPWYARFMPSDPYAGMSASKLMERANANPDDAAAFFRADAALRKERPEMFEKKSEDGMAHGGVAGGKQHKDAVVMKALEIIHHMLRTR